MTELELQYQGFLNTPNLWFNNAIYQIQQFELLTDQSNFNTQTEPNLRLGKLVERFVSHQLHQDKSISVLAENIQIQNEKLTIGELDCILLKDDKPIHLEIIYKFYLFDDSVGTTTIEHWIGPNRKDSLIQKLDKLKNKQLPLLYNQYTKPLLETLNLNAESMKQMVCFKAQLFVPLNKLNHSFKLINNDCIAGFYIYKEELNQFKACQFYIPKKTDWLTEIQPEVNWLSFNTFCNEVKLLLDNYKSPLCWIKNPDGSTQKCFVVWWV